MSLLPKLVRAAKNGAIREDSRLVMAARAGDRIFRPREEDLVPLPPESELFLLPGRRPLGIDHASGEIVQGHGLAVAAFATPGYTISAHPAYEEEPDAPVLPLFAYGAVGYARGRFWICGRQVDTDQRQRFASIRRGRLEKDCRNLLRKYSGNRLVGHIIRNCAMRYACPAARNFALGRYEAPLPTSRACNARCVGCISLVQPDMPQAVTPQCRLDFTPTPGEIAEVMRIHAEREKKTPIYSFGQGCEGDPLSHPALLSESIRLFRADNGPGTINCNTNASVPEAIEELATAGLTSMRVSLNSARPDAYAAYYRPVGYDFSTVRRSIRLARKAGVHVALNLLYFPGLTDTEAEINALAALCGEDGVSMIQLRNLNIDPLWLTGYMDDHAISRGISLGLNVFMEKLRELCPWLHFGYFNPWLGEKARITAPLPE